ncbi:MAG: hypothetical protein FWF28_07190 [Micrococcales bacterium]|nr:hypothetical protein [Micrococcales bacterium]
MIASTSGRFGPQTGQVEAYLALLPTLAGEQWSVAWDAARTAARNAVWSAAWIAGRNAAWDAGRNAARSGEMLAAWGAVQVAAAGDGPGDGLGAARVAARGADWLAAVAAEALVVRDLITSDQFEILVAPMRAAGIDFDTLGEVAS